MDAHGIEAVETVPASRKLGRDDAVKLVKSAARVVAAKGKRVEEFKPGGKASQQVVGALLGPTGNLRAPWRSFCSAAVARVREVQRCAGTR
jgi:hypothetical protein